MVNHHSVKESKDVYFRPRSSIEHFSTVEGSRGQRSAATVSIERKTSSKITCLYFFANCTRG